MEPLPRWNLFFFKFVVRTLCVNLPHPKPSSKLYFVLLSFWCFSILVNLYFQVFFMPKAIFVGDQTMTSSFRLIYLQRTILWYYNTMGFLLSRIWFILYKTEDQKGARFPNTTPLSQMPANSHTQILAPLSAASLTASHIPSYGRTVTLVSLLSSALSKPRWLDTALSSLAASINKLKAQGGWRWHCKVRGESCNPENIASQPEHLMGKHDLMMCCQTF